MWRHWASPFGEETRQCHSSDVVIVVQSLSHVSLCPRAAVVVICFYCCLVTKSVPMDYSTPAFFVLHCLPEFAEIRVH